MHQSAEIVDPRLSDSGHRPPDHQVTNYVMSKIFDVMQSVFARVPTCAPEPLNM
jgi:hypothetical protein